MCWALFLGKDRKKTLVCLVREKYFSIFSSLNILKRMFYKINLFFLNLKKNDFHSKIKKNIF